MCSNILPQALTALAVFTSCVNSSGANLSATPTATDESVADTFTPKVYEKISYAEYGDLYTVSDSIGVSADGKTKYAWGVIDNTGREIIPCRYDTFVWFNSAGFAKAYLSDSTATVVDLNGNEIITPLDAYDLSLVGSDSPDSCYLVTTYPGQPTRIFRLPGMEKVTEIPGNLRVVADIREGRIPVFDVSIDNYRATGYYSLDGREVVPPYYYLAGPFSCGLAPVLECSEPEPGYVSYGPFYKLGFIDRNGNMVFQESSSDCGYLPVDAAAHLPQFSEGLVALISNDNNGYDYFDISGRKIISIPDVSAADDFHNGKAIITDADDHCWYIDRTGKRLGPAVPLHGKPQYSVVRSNPRDSDSLMGYADSTGKIVIPCRYYYAYNFDNNYAIVELTGNSGKDLIDANGRTVLKHISRY